MSDTLTKLTVNLTERSRAALDHAEALTSDSRTEVVARALQLYALLVDNAASAPVRGTGFKTLVVEDLLGDDVAYDVWVRRAR
jgi:hypothetical protein